MPLIQKACYADTRIRIHAWHYDDFAYFVHKGVNIYFEGNQVLDDGLPPHDLYLPGQWETYFHTLVLKAKMEEERRQKAKTDAEGSRLEQAKLDERHRYGL